MKFILFALLFSSMAMATDIQTSLSESNDGLTFSLYEVAYPSEEAPLWTFAASLNQKEMTTSDKNFSFRCKQSQVTKGVFETRCTGILKESISPTAVGSIGDDFISITLTGKSAEEFFSIFPKENDTVSINVKDKLVLVGSGIHFGILVRH